MKVSTFKKIRTAMVSWERSALTEIKRANRDGRGYSIPDLSDLRFYKAMDRLKEKGLISFVRAPRPKHWSYYPRHGYWATALRKGN